MLKLNRVVIRLSTLFMYVHDTLLTWWIYVQFCTS